MPDGALTGLKVLDFTHYVAGPYCAKLLADYGADVIKVEPPGGDGARRLGPFSQDVPHREKSGLFLHLNTNKRGIVVDLKSDGAPDVIAPLVRWADIVVENFRPGVADRLGIGYRQLIGLNPDLIYTSISNFGQNGSVWFQVMTTGTLSTVSPKSKRNRGRRRRGLINTIAQALATPQVRIPLQIRRAVLG